MSHSVWREKVTFKHLKVAGSITQLLEGWDKPKTLLQPWGQRQVCPSISDTLSKCPDQRSLQIVPETNYFSSWQVPLRCSRWWFTGKSLNIAFKWYRLCYKMQIIDPHAVAEIKGCLMLSNTIASRIVCWVHFQVSSLPFTSSYISVNKYTYMCTHKHFKYPKLLTRDSEHCIFLPI